MVNLTSTTTILEAASPVPSTCDDTAAEVVISCPSNTVTPSVTLALVEDIDAAGEVVSHNPSNTTDDAAGEVVSPNPSNTVTLRVSRLHSVAPTNVVNFKDVSAIVNPFLLQCGIYKDGDLELVESNRVALASTIKNYCKSCKNSTP